MHLVSESWGPVLLAEAFLLPLKQTPSNMQHTSILPFLNSPCAETSMKGKRRKASVISIVVPCCCAEWTVPRYLVSNERKYPSRQMALCTLDEKKKIRFDATDNQIMMCCHVFTRRHSYRTYLVVYVVRICPVFGNRDSLLPQSR